MNFPSPPTDYDVSKHVSYGRSDCHLVQVDIPHALLPSNRGEVVRTCGEFLHDETAYFIDVYEERRSPGSPPRWSDGGNPARTFISENRLEEDMCHEEPAEEDILTFTELSEVLAEATNTTSEEIERGAAEIEIAPPWEGEIVGYEDGPLTDAP